MRTKLLAVFILLLFVVAAPFAYADEEVGDVASIVNNAVPVPAGHFAIIASYADQFLSNSPSSRIIAPTTFAVPTDANGFPVGAPAKNLSDFHIIDIRGNEAYVANHVPGAVNVPFVNIAKPENLATYPTDKPLLVICYSGHTASISGGILNTLGLNGYILRGGMSGWPCNTNQPVKNKDGQIIGGYYFGCEQ